MKRMQKSVKEKCPKTFNISSPNRSCSSEVTWSGRIRARFPNPTPSKSLYGRHAAGSSSKSESNLMGKFTTSVRRLVKDAESDHSREGALQTYSRLKNVTHTVSESYGTVKNSLTTLHQQYESSKAERNLLRRYSLFRNIIKTVIRLDAQYWLLVDVPKQEKQEQVASYVLRTCAALEKTAESRAEANSSKHGDNGHKEPKLDDMTIEEIEDENSQQINDLYRLLKKYANLKKIVHELNVSYTGSKIYPIIPRYNLLKDMIKDVLRHPHYMEVCHEDG